MPISTMLNRVSRMSSAPASTRTCPTISPAVRFRTSPILPVRQNAHAIAQPTWVEMQKVIAGVSGMKTDSMWRPSARRSRNFSVPSMEVSRWASAGVRQREIARERRAQLQRQIGHRRDVGDAAAVDPPEDLAGVEALVSARVERHLERRAFQVGEVRPLSGAHAYLSRFSALCSFRW